jgi:FkbM family methyltransferase
MTRQFTKHSVTFSVNTASNPAFWDSHEKMSWEKETFEVFFKLLNKESIVIDIGSWEGPFTLFSAILAKKVFAIEPDPVAFKSLKENIALNPALKEKIICSQLAFSEKEGTVKLFARNSYGDSASSLLSRSRDSSKGINVTTITFKNFISENEIKKAQFIKMDIEGAEFFILPGMSSALKEIELPFLLVSFHPKYLQEYFMRKRIPGRFFSKAVFKVADMLGIFLFDKKVKKLYIQSFEALKDYPFIYQPQGRSIDKTIFFAQKKYRESQAVLFSSTEIKF